MPLQEAPSFPLVPIPLYSIASLLSVFSDNFLHSLTGGPSPDNFLLSSAFRSRAFVDVNWLFLVLDQLFITSVQFILAGFGVNQSPGSNLQPLFFHPFAGDTMS